MIPFPKIEMHVENGNYVMRTRDGKPVEHSTVLWLTTPWWEFLDRDEDYIEDQEVWDEEKRPKLRVQEGSFICCGCNKRRPNSCGGADETLISRVCDHCTVKTWHNLAHVVQAIALQQQSR